MLTTSILALAILASDPTPAAMLFPWEVVTPVRYHWRHRYHRRHYRRYRPFEAPPNCDKINAVGRQLTQVEIEEALPNRRQRAIYDKCQQTQ